MIVVFVISLVRSTLRRKFIKKHLDFKKIDFNYVNGVDLLLHSEEAIIANIDEHRRQWTNHLRSGAVCCALSHLQAYDIFLQSADEFCLILEDDAKLTISKLTLDSILSTISSENFDVYVLHSASHKKVILNKLKNISENFSIYVPAGYQAPGSGLAYVINRHAAEQIRKYNYPVKATADSWQEFIADLGLKIAFIKPDIFISSNFESTINYVSKNNTLKIFIPNWIRKIKRFRLSRRMRNNVILK